MSSHQPYVYTDTDTLKWHYALQLFPRLIVFQPYECRASYFHGLIHPYDFGMSHRESKGYKMSYNSNLTLLNVNQEARHELIKYYHKPFDTFDFGFEKLRPFLLNADLDTLFIGVNTAPCRQANSTFGGRIKVVIIQGLPLKPDGTPVKEIVGGWTWDLVCAQKFGCLHGRKANWLKDWAKLEKMAKKKKPQPVEDA